MKAFVSIVMPVYNVELYLHESIDSVIMQTYCEWELILVDDGSTDRSGAICDEYADSNERIVVIHQENKGLSAARNSGTSVAGGEYIYFLDSDDCLASDAIEQLILIANQYAAEVVYFDAKVMDENSIIDEANTEYIHKKKYCYATVGKKQMQTLFRETEFFTCVPMLFIRRKCLDNLLFYEGIIHEDILFSFQLFIKAEVVVHLPMQLYLRRIRTGSIMTSNISERNVTSLITIINYIVIQYSELVDSDIRAAMLCQLVVLKSALIEYYFRLPLWRRRKIVKEYKSALLILRNVGIDAPPILICVKKIMCKYLPQSILRNVIAIKKHIKEIAMKIQA